MPKISSSQILYLGTTVGGPRWQVKRSYRGIPNDLAGGTSGEPMDMSYLGQSAIISLDMGRWDPVVMEALDASPNFIRLREGEEIFGDIGSIAGLESAYAVLYIQHPYATKPAMQAAGVPAGFRFLRAVMVGPTDFAEQGTVASRRNIIFQTVRAYNHQDGSFKLFDHNMDGVPAFPPS